jgi:hypothetical protein
MQDREFKIGDRVKFSDEGLIIRGEIEHLSTESTEARIRIMDKLATWYVSIHDLELDLPEEEVFNPDRHDCVPYVGIFRVEAKCVHCNRYITEQEVIQYIRKIGE